MTFFDLSSDDFFRFCDSKQLYQKKRYDNNGDCYAINIETGQLLFFINIDSVVIRVSKEEK